MPRHYSNGDRGRSSPYDSSKDRNSHHNKKSRDSEEVRTREQNRDRARDRDWHHGDHHDKSVRNYRGRLKNEDHGYSRNHEHGRRNAFAGDREKHHRHRSRSRSPESSDNRARSKSNSPSRTRSKRRSGFDMAPPGATSAPGIAEFPGVSDIPRAISGMLQNMVSETTQANQLGYFSLFPAQTMSQQATRHARRVYVGGLPPLANEQTIATFFSHVMLTIGGNSAGPGDAVVNVYINHEKKFAFVEMRTVEEASNAMALDGILFEGVALRVRRPTDYNPSMAAALGPSQPSPHLNLAAAGLTPGMSSDADGADRIFVGGLPYYFSETQIKELLESFGALRGFDLVKDRDTGNSKGYGFCIYKDPAVTDMACAALNGLKLGDKTLTVRRATMSGQVRSEQENMLAQAQQHIAFQRMALEAGGGAMETSTAGNPTKVLCLNEAISTEELMDDGEYEEILQDMKEECQKFGDLINVIIPRPNLNEGDLQGLGKVFLEYSDTTGCANARAALSGRKFGGKAVIAIYYPEDRFYGGDYNA